MSESDKPKSSTPPAKTEDSGSSPPPPAHNSGHKSAPQDPSWADSPAVAQRILVGLSVTCIALFFSDLLYHKHAHFSFEEILGFHALFGFVAYVTIVNSAKLLRRLVMRKEDYYDE